MGSFRRTQDSAGAALADRLAPVQDALAVLERETFTAARVGDRPDAWAAWADVNAALMAVRAAQGRAARGDRRRETGGTP